MLHIFGASASRFCEYQPVVHSREWLIDKEKWIAKNFVPKHIP
jgi:hypothetical protein